MPVNSNIQIPFIPQEGITSQILTAIQLANEAHQRQQQLGIQQQQVSQQGALIPSTIAEHEATTKRLAAQTDMERMNLDYRRQLIGTLTGQMPGATPVQPTATPSGTPAQTPGGAAPQAAPMAPAPHGVIGSTMNDLLNDEQLTPEEKKAIRLAGSNAVMQSFGQEPEKALASLTSTYNDILKQHGEENRAIIHNVLPDKGSPTGYSEVLTRKGDGSEVNRIVAQAPVPKNLEEATSYLGLASYNDSRGSTPGTQAALALAKKQHDAMYADKMAEVAQNARASAVARGVDYEAMIRTGENPITKEKLGLNNAPPSALVNPANGQVIPQDMLSLYKPTQNERQTADTARQVIAISDGLRKQVEQNPNLIGPILGRSQEALQKAGFSSEQASKLIDDVSLLQSAATKMHTGRFSNEILNKMGNTIKPGMNPDEFKGALDSLHDVATRYANEDKLTTVYEFQQRQQFEQGGGGPQAPTGGLQVGQPVSIKGKQMKITAVHPDGTFDAQ